MKSFSELKNRFLQIEKESVAPVAKIVSKRPFFSDASAGVFGVHRPDPVDRAAAMMLSKSRWKHLPKSEENKKESVKKMTDKRVKIQDIHEAMTGEAGLSFNKQKSGGEAVINIDELALQVCSRIESALPNKMSKLAVYVCDSRDAINAAIENIGATMEEFDRRVTSAMDSVRAKRMSIVSEASLATNALKDVRQFFIGKDYEDEKKRLAEFVDLCERLQKLKDSGFLDTVADTMIRLDRNE